MKQALHIFAKDARHFLPEILISLAITAAFAWIYPKQWPVSMGAVAGGDFLIPQVWALLAGCLTLLIPVSWWLLITRVIHAENLVGDRQFWITRPYEWQKLLSAKLLFLLCFLYLPILIAQCILLARAGFHPLAFLPGLLFNLLLITGMVVLPLLALSTVTSTFARMTLTILGIILSFIAFAALAATIDHSSISNPLPDRFSLPLILGGCLAAVVLQYFKRRTGLARLLLVATVVLVWASSAVVSDESAIRRAYPRTGNTPPPSLQLLISDDLQKQPIAYTARSRRQVGITLPLQISGIADGQAWSADNVKVSIQGPGNLTWTSPWQAMNSSEHYLPGQSDLIAHFEMSRAIFDQIKSAPVTLHLTFAWTQLRSGQTQRVLIPVHDFEVPGFGICSPAVAWSTPSQIDQITCRHALRQPPLTYLDTRWSEDRCSSAPTPSAAGIEGSGWAGTLDTTPAEFSISTVSSNPLQFSNNWSDDSVRPTKPRHLCAGTPLTFTTYSLAQRTQSDITIPNFRLPAYKGPQEADDRGFGVMIAPH